MVYLSTRLGLQWMGNVFSHLLKLPLDFFEKRHLGDITSRMGSVQTIQRTLTTSFVEALIDGVLATNAAMVAEFHAGKEKAFNALVGQAMKATKGKANPQQVNELLRKKLG